MSASHRPFWFASVLRQAAAALLALLPVTSAQADQSRTQLIDLVHAPWRPIVKNACHAMTVEDRESGAGIYFSDYLEAFRKLLILDGHGHYHLMYWSHPESAPGRMYTGSYKRAGDKIALDITLDTNSLGSDANDGLLVPMSLGDKHFLLLDTRLKDIGTSIQWRGVMGESDQYYLKVRCEDTPPTFKLAGPSVPARTELPDALKRFVFKKPVTARITALVDDLHGYDHAARDGEFLVRIDKGSNDVFRINMPLCSARGSGQHWKGWVSDHIGPDWSEVRVVIRERGHNRPFEFPAVGQLLNTSATECLDEDAQQG